MDGHGMAVIGFFTLLTWNKGPWHGTHVRQAVERVLGGVLRHVPDVEPPEIHPIGSLSPLGSWVVFVKPSGLERKASQVQVEEMV